MTSPLIPSPLPIEPSSPGVKPLAVALLELSDSVAASLSVDEVYGPALRCLQDSLGVERSAILIFDGSGTPRFRAWTGLSATYRAAVDGHSPWQPDATDALPVLVGDVRTESSLASLGTVFEAERIRALAFIPLESDGHLLGKFMLYYAEAHEFTSAELTAAQVIAGQVAFAISQHRARQEQQLASALLAGQKYTLELMVGGAPLPAVLASLVRLVEHSSEDGATASVLLIDKDGRFTNGASPSLPPEYVAAIEGVPAVCGGGGCCCEAAGRGQPVFTPDIAMAPEWDGLRDLPLSAGFLGAWSQPIFGQGGEVLGTFGTYFRDRRHPTAREREVVEVLAGTASVAIEHARAEQQRRRQRNHLNAMFRSTDAGVIETDPDSRFLMVNDRFCEMVGRSREELLAGLDCIVVTHEADRARKRQCVEALKAGGSNYTIEKRLDRPDGREIWVSSNVSAIRSQTGELRGAVSIVTDITERKRADAQVAASETRYRSLIEGLGLAVYTTDAAGHITMYNDAAVALWGRHPQLGAEKWCGSWRIFSLDGDPLAHHDCPLGVSLREDREVRDVAIVVERPDGSRATILPYPTPMHDASGRLVGAVNVLVDITELQATQDALHDALRAKDDFLGQISHELRNPLTQIAGNAEYVLRNWQTLSPATHEESMTEIRWQATRLQRLVDNMLVLSRFERGMRPDVEPQLIQRILHDTIYEFRQRYPHTRIDIAIDDGLPPVETSVSTLDQVVWNLLTNAQKYGPAAGPVELHARSCHGVVEVAVRDYGPGVPSADMDRLFDPYFRASNTPEATGGLGLGLSICQRMIEAQNGELWARNMPGGGMEFGVRFSPIIAADEEA